MPFVAHRTTARGRSSVTILLTFLLATVIIIVALIVVFHGIMHLF